MKRTLALILTLLMIISIFSGCADSSGEASSPPESSAPQTETSATPIDAEPQPDTEPQPDAEPPAPEPEPELAFQYPRYEDRRTISVITLGNADNINLLGGDMSNTYLLQHAEELFNVDFDIYAPTDLNVQFGLMLASQEYYDLILTPDSYYAGGIDAIVNDEICYDLVPWLDEYAPAFSALLDSDPDYRRQLTSDSGYLTTMRLYATISNDGFMIRADWLDKVGMERPLTYSEMHDVLTAFKTTFDTDAPFWVANNLTFNNNTFTCGYGFYTDAMGFDMPWGVDENGTVYCPYLIDGYYEFLVMMNQWYNEGLIDSDFYTSGMIWDREGYILGGTTGMYVGNLSQASPNYYALQDDPDFRIEASYDIRKNPDDILRLGGTKTNVSNQMGLAISTQCEDPQTVLSILDWFFSEEGNFLSTWGIEGETFEYDNSNNPKLMDYITNNQDYTISQMITKTFGSLPGGINDEEKALRTCTSEAEFEAYDYWNYNKTEELVYYGSLTVEESDLYMAKSGDILTYADECVIKFVTGDLPLSDFKDVFVPTVLSLGLEELVQLKQNAYDRYMAR